MQPRNYTSDILPLELAVSFGRITVHGQEEVHMMDHPERALKLRMRADVILLAETWPLNHEEREELSDTFQARYRDAVRKWNLVNPDMPVHDIFIFVRVLDRFGG